MLHLLTIIILISSDNRYYIICIGDVDRSISMDKKNNKTAMHG